jgi:catechol 2,3-dioxygenase-like lactoylglutathione lyase family enzyme
MREMNTVLRNRMVLKGLHHVGISVQDLDRSVAFYCGLLGMEIMSIDSFDGGVMDRITGLTGTRGRSATLAAGVQQLELFEFSAPTPERGRSPSAVSNFGISHFCIEVTDIQQEYNALKAAGIKMHCEPQTFGDMKATYGRDPDGNVFELLEVHHDDGGTVIRG